MANREALPLLSRGDSASGIEGSVLSKPWGTSTCALTLAVRRQSSAYAEDRIRADMRLFNERASGAIYCSVAGRGWSALALLVYIAFPS